MVDDRELDRILRASAPGARPNDAHRRLLQAQLDHNFRHHRRRAWPLLPAAAAALALVVALAIGWTTPIGSDVRDLVDEGRRLPDGDAILHQPFRGGKINQREDGDQGRRQAEDMMEDIESGAYEVLGVEGFTFAGETYFNLVVRTDRDATGSVTMGIPEYEAAKQRFVARLRPHLQAFLACLQEEDSAVESVATMVIAGREFRVSTSSCYVAGLGEILRHRGTLVGGPPDDGAAR